jgi:glycosidase
MVLSGSSRATLFPLLSRLACVRALSPAALALVVAGCSDEATKARDYGSSPDSGAYNPGNGTGGGDYGSGSGSSTGGSSGGGLDAGPPVCADSLKRCAAEVTFAAGTETAVELRGDWDAPDSWAKGIAMQKVGSEWKAKAPFPYGRSVQYKFCINPSAAGVCAEWRTDTTKPTAAPDNNNVYAAMTCQTFTCVDPPALPVGVFDWRDAVIYFPMVDRFVDGDGQNTCKVSDSRVADLANYKGGDWAGITKKITEGYFSDLGVNTIWLSVPVDNAIGPDEGVGGNAGKWFTGYHAYWPRDLDPANPYRCFGTAADLKTLVDTAHAKGMKVVVDYAMVHVHVTSPIYAAHKDWFFTDNGNPYANCDSTGWEVFSGDGNGGWQWDGTKPGNKCWFTPMLAHWNFGNDTARAFSTDNVVSWIKTYGFDGLRLDAIKHVDIRWLTDVRTKITSQIMPNKPSGERFYLLGETYDGDPAKLRVHIDPAKMLDGQFDFALRPAVETVMLRNQGSMNDLMNAVNTSENAYGAGVVMSTFVGNHDQVRAIGAAGGEGNSAAYERLANAFSMLLTVKGAPSILYGDEIGMGGGADPDNRRMMTFSGWSTDQTNLKNRIARLTKIRADHPALRRGRRDAIASNNNLWVFSMTSGADTVYVAINRGDNAETATGLPSSALTELVAGGSVMGPSLSIPARQTRVFVKP